MKNKKKKEEEEKEDRSNVFIYTSSDEAVCVYLSIKLYM